MIGDIILFLKKWLKQNITCRHEYVHKELGRILLAMGDISVVFATSCNDKQIQLQDVKGIKLENNIVTLI